MIPGQFFQASFTFTTHEYGRIASGYYKLPAGVTIASATPDGGGSNVTVVFTGQSLGSWAQMLPIAAAVGADGSNNLIIQPVGGSSSSSGIS